MVHRVPGTHTTMMLERANAGVLAERMKASLTAPSPPAPLPAGEGSKPPSPPAPLPGHHVLMVGEGSKLPSPPAPLPEGEGSKTVTEK